MSRLSDLLREVARGDSQLADDVAAEIRHLGERRAFGLNFERHTPETVELPGRPIRKGDKVRFLPARGSSPVRVDNRLWRVSAITRTDTGRIATLVRKESEDTKHVTVQRSLENLVVVAEFRDPIYPGLVSTGSIERGEDKPFHSVINAENFHALQALLYTHEGKVDAIYIDPPYNTGARDWKYNNDYVDSEDAYRHSKWLAFMERRLRLARRLLNPGNSVLIVTIDEKEYLRLGLLLEQVFPEAKIQMVSSLINPKGSSRNGQFARSDEYLFFVGIGAAAPAPQLLGPEWQGSRLTTTTKIRWVSMIRSGTGVARADRPGMFYPVLLAARDGSFVSVGDALAAGASRSTFQVPAGVVAVWPIREDETEGRWQVGPQTARALRESGFLRVGKFRGESTAISYLKSGEQKKVIDGLFGDAIRSADGHVEVEGATAATTRVPTTQWALPSHSASEHGSRLLRNLIPGRKFDFPKSLYAVEDALRFYVSTKPEAVVVDFFAGSGTTAHAVMRLNRQDGGTRQSISVTNNEVGVDGHAGLRARGHRRGDPEWEALGICDYITKPRLAAAVTGQTPEGKPVKGDYRFVDEFPMADGFEENIKFFTMSYEAPRPVAHNRSFEAISPLLWLKAGARGRRIEKASEAFDVADTYGVMFDMDASKGFLEALRETPTARTAFIVTDDDRSYQMVCAELPSHVDPVRLYESYLTNFTINTGRD